MDDLAEVDSSASWLKRLKWLFYGHHIKNNPNISEALTNVSRVLADFFEHDSNLVASDIAVALVLLKRKQMLTEFGEAGLRGRPSDCPSSYGRRAVTYAEIESVSYYFQYAGIRMFVRYIWRCYMLIATEFASQ